jgi:hypothetical protein
MITPYKYYPTGQVDYWCLQKDVPNLPKKLDNKLANGSTAYCIDNQNVYLYDEENDEWKLQ